MFGPWFMKPYFRFAENFDRATLEAMPQQVQKLLHLKSTPPRNSNGRTATLSPEPIFE